MNENYQDLANEIIAQAARDYERALIKEREGKLERKEIEEFFTGPYFNALTTLDGPARLWSESKRQLPEIITRWFLIRKTKRYKPNNKDTL